ncbi:MAG: hypothetical protein JWP44_3136 [Mucilaginibacter sp.]|nr:hypothetical protein [Mucilaginibacter sp.]
MKKPILLIFLLSLITGVFAQGKQGGDSTRKNAIPGNFAGNAAQRLQPPKPYKSVITEKAISHSGLFKVHKVEDKYYFEIPDSVLNREMLVVARIAKAGAEVRAADGYAGDQISSTVVRFEKGPNNRIFLRKISYSTYSPDSTKSMYQAVQRSNIQAIAAAFNIAAFSPDKDGSVIDVTDYINSDSEIFFFGSPQAKQRWRMGTIAPDRSYIDNIRTFKNNVEISTVKTYAQTAPMAQGGRGGVPAPSPTAGGGGSSGSVTVELNTSLVILPKVPMKSRYFDPRVGYFTVGYTDFDENPQGIKNIQLIARWRLEPKPGDMDKYMRGELVEPRKPIVYYIDPATPKKWVPYLIAGVEDWQKAFEAAGFKHAIIAKVAPTAKEDSTWSLDDATHSVIVYKPSETENASGPHVSDPRSGEILETHINWYHNVMKLVHDWYMIQTAAVDPRARKMEFDDKLMGDLIRFVSSHEVGHTLGLRHNYGSSSTVPVEKLRDKAFVEANGHTPSIMDYARFNYVAQPEDKIGPKGLYPRIGDYDIWAIEWGYKMMPDEKGGAADVPALNKITVERLKNRRLWFGTEINPDDPHSQNEDLGDNAMKASDYGIMNLKRIIVKLPEWTREPNQGYDDLDNMYTQLTTQFNRYMGHVAKNIGGIYENPKTVEQEGIIYEYTPAATQKEAMGFLNRQLFTTPAWMLDEKILNQIGQTPLQVIYHSQEPVLNRLISAHTLNKLLAGEAANGPSAYKITDFFNDMNSSIFKEVKNKQPIDIYRRDLQKLYVNKLIDLIKPKAPAEEMAAAAPARTGGRSTPRELEETDVISVAKGQLRMINNMIKTAIPNIADPMSAYHLQDLSDRIKEALNPKG